MEDYETLVVELGDKKIEWEYIGEGYNGEFDEDDDDTRLLRFTAFEKNPEDLQGLNWVEIENGSWCTELPLETTPTTQLAYLAVEMIEVLNKGEENLERYASLSPNED